MTTNDGGPAFPVAEDHKVASDLEWTSGMSLRDWFAGQAMAGIMANPTSFGLEFPEHGDPQGTANVASAFAVLIADAMLAARQKGDQ